MNTVYNIETVLNINTASDKKRPSAACRFGPSAKKARGGDGEDYEKWEARLSESFFRATGDSAEKIILQAVKDISEWPKRAEAWTLLAAALAAFERLFPRPSTEDLQCLRQSLCSKVEAARLAYPPITKSQIFQSFQDNALLPALEIFDATFEDMSAATALDPLADFGGKAPKQRAVSCLRAHEDPSVRLWQSNQGRNTSYMKYHVGTALQMFKRVKGIERPKDLHFYEQLQSNHTEEYHRSGDLVTGIYFDLECCRRENPSVEETEVIRALQRSLIRFHAVETKTRGKYEEWLCPSACFILSASNAKKFSLHVRWLSSHNFKSVYDVRAYMQKYEQYLQREKSSDTEALWIKKAGLDKLMIDQSVYCDRAFRLWRSSKWKSGEYRPLQLLGEAEVLRSVDYLTFRVLLCQYTHYSGNLLDYGAIEQRNASRKRQKADTKTNATLEGMEGVHKFELALAYALKHGIYPAGSRIISADGKGFRVQHPLETGCPFGVTHNSNCNTSLTFEGLNEGKQVFRIHCYGRRCHIPTGGLTPSYRSFAVGFEFNEAQKTPPLHVAYSTMLTGSRPSYSMKLQISEDFTNEIKEKSLGVPPLQHGLLKLTSLRAPAVFRDGNRCEQGSIMEGAVVQVTYRLVPALGNTWADMLEVDLIDDGWNQEEDDFPTIGTKRHGHDSSELIPRKKLKTNGEVFGQPTGQQTTGQPTEPVQQPTVRVQKPLSSDELRSTIGTMLQFVTEESGVKKAFGQLTPVRPKLEGRGRTARLAFKTEGQKNTSFTLRKRDAGHLVLRRTIFGKAVEHKDVVLKMGQMLVALSDRMFAFHHITRIEYAKEIDEVKPIAKKNERSCDVIDASCGMKKSFQIREYIKGMKKRNKALRILFVTVRRLHAINLDAEIGAVVGSERRLYLQDRIGEKDDVVVISLESLFRLENYPSFDIIIFDEIRSLAAICSSPTLKNFKSINVLAAVCKDSQSIIAADADVGVDDAVLEMFSGLVQDRPIVHHVYRYRKLKRKLRCYFKTKEHKDLREEISVYLKQGKRIAICCGANDSQAKLYARFLQQRGIPFKLYTSDTSEKQKREDFREPDKAFGEVAAVIFTSTLSVAVDPRTTVFDKLFLHTCRLGSNLRDQFQGLNRFGRFVGGLKDIEIIAMIDQRPPAESDTPKEVSYEHVLRCVIEERLCTLRHSLACTGLMDTIMYTLKDSWFLRTQAWNDLERQKQSVAHFEAVKAFAEHLDWEVSVATKALNIENEVGLEGAVPSSLQLMVKKDQYEYTMKQIKGSDSERRFWDDCLGIENAETTEEIVSKRVFHLLRPWKEFVPVEDFLKIQSRQNDIKRHALLRCIPLEAQMRRDASLFTTLGGKLHPMLNHVDSQSIRYGKRLENIIGQPLLEEGNLSNEWIRRINDEKDLRRRPVQEDDMQKDDVQEDRDVQEDNAQELDVLACMQKMICKLEASADEIVRKELSSAISGLGCRVRVDTSDSLKSLRFVAQRFSMTLKCKMGQRRVRNERIRYVKGLALVKDMPKYLEDYELRCPQCSAATYVRVNNWSEHQREYHGHSIGWE